MKEQGNENQEYPREEVPRWQNQGMDNILPFSPPEDEYGAPQQRGGKFGSIGTTVITVIISLVLCYAMVSLLGISPSMKQYKADITRLELDLVDVRAVDAAMNAELDGLTNASIIAQNASTIATEAKDLVTTLQADYTSLNASLTALDNRIVDLESNSGDIYDDTIIRGLITAVEEDITAINTTITALQVYDTSNTATISALQNKLSELEDDIDDLDSGSTIYNDTELRGLIMALTERVTALENNLEPVIFTEFNSDFDYCKFKVNKSGTYVVILTLYGEGFTGINDFLITADSQSRILSCDVIGDKIAILALTQKDTLGNPTNWVANTIVTIGKNNEIPAVNIKYGTIQVGER